MSANCEIGAAATAQELAGGRILQWEMELWAALCVRKTGRPNDFA
jgi:hypothetical protein